MSSAAVREVGEAQRALSRALDAGSPQDIGAATEALARAVQSLRAAGAWHATPELKALVRQAMREGEGARVRVRYLAEHGRVRLARLQALTGRAPVGYGRDGRHRAV